MLNMKLPTTNPDNTDTENFLLTCNKINQLIECESIRRTMNLRTDPIHQDVLLDRLWEHGNSFIDEESRIVSLDYFIPVFTYKYGGLLSSWTVWIEYGTAYNEIHCRNISGMKFVFPLVIKGGKRPRLSKREIRPQIKH
jgi:hypothetical protein